MAGPPSTNTNSLIITSKPCSTTSMMIKFLCSYGGKIVPRYPDGKLGYHGGETRVLAVQRSISFSELMGKLVEMSGGIGISSSSSSSSSSRVVMSLRCKLPEEDLDALVSITSDEDLSNLIEEYDNNNDNIGPPIFPPLASSNPIKIRAFLFALPRKASLSSSLSSPIHSTNIATASSSSSSSSSSKNTASSKSSMCGSIGSNKIPRVPRQMMTTLPRRRASPFCYENKVAGKSHPQCASHFPRHIYLHVHNGNH